MAETDDFAPFPELVAYREAWRKGEFLLPQCRSCGRTHWYPRNFCPFCDSTELVRIPAAGTGVIYSYTVMRRAEPPYVLAYIRLTEGPCLMTNIVDADIEALKIGAAVQVVRDGPYPVLFRPVENANAQVRE